MKDLSWQYFESLVLNVDYRLWMWVFVALFFVLIIGWFITAIYSRPKLFFVLIRFDFKEYFFFWLYTCLTILAMCFTVNWYEMRHTIELLPNYVVGIVLFALVSVVFALIGHTVYMIDMGSFSVNKELLKFELDKDSKTAKRKIEVENLRLRKGIMISLFDLIQNRSDAVVEDFEKVSGLISEDQRKLFYRYDNKVLLLNVLDQSRQAFFFTVVRVHGDKTFNTNFVIVGEETLFFPDFKGDMVRMMSDRTVKKEIIEKLISDMEVLSEYELPKKEECLFGYLPMYVFVYSFMMDLFGVRVGYLTPLSFKARAVFLFFTIYRFFLLGTFISLFLK